MILTIATEGIMTKRLLKSSVIIIILAILTLFGISLYTPQNICAYADEPSLPTIYWSASYSLAGNGLTDTTPYIISSPYDFAYLANAVTTGDSFDGKYFSLTTNLDMSGYLTMPVGSFSGVNNRAFNGIFEGNGHTISGLVINRSSENTALFGYLGSNAVVRNFTIAQGSIIVGTRYTASVAGRCEGKVEGVLSFADVSGTSPIGGIVGHNYQGQVNNCVFAGSLTGSDSKHGVEGASFNGTGSGSWYVTDNFSYTHNARGNVLYTGTNGSLTPDVVLGVPTFTLTPDIGFENQVRTADESIISTDTTFVPESGLNNARYFARFVKTVTIAPQVNGVVSGAGTYYEGQTVNIKIAPSEGYYFDYITSDITPSGASYANDVDNSVIYSFPMSNVDISFSVTLTEFVPQTGAITTEFVYDGNSKIVTTEEILQQSNVAYEDFSFAISCLCPIQGTLPTFAHKAGQYSAMVTISNYIESSLIIIGRMEYPYVISKAQLEIDDPLLFPSSKQYDNIDSFTISVEDNYQVIGADIVTMSANVTYYTDAIMDTIAYSIGENYYVQYVFSIVGADSNNYLPPEPLAIPNASITKRVALVSIEERFLTRVFNETPPSVQTYAVDSVGGIDIEFIFIHMDNPESIYDVGSYTVEVQFKEDAFNPNNDNHILLLEKEYIYEITPMEVAVSFSGYQNLFYTGAVQAITALHGTIYAGVFLPANIVYKMDGDEVPLLNAGDYIAYAHPTNTNYQFSAETATCAFNVAKIYQTDSLYVEQLPDTTYNIQPILLTASGGNGDGAITYTLVSGKASISDDILILSGAGVIKIQATKA